MTQAHQIHRSSSPSPHVSSHQFDPWIIWVTFRRCWMWAIPVGAVLAGIAAFIVMRNFVPTYRAEHLLEANQDYLVYAGVMPTYSNLAGTEKTFFYNPIVIDPVLNDPRLRELVGGSDANEAESKLLSNLSVAHGGTPTRLAVRYTHTDRQASADICNAIVDSYLRQRDAFDNSRVSNLEKWLTPEIERWEEEVNTRQDRIQSLSKSTLGKVMISNGPGGGSTVVEDRTNLSLMMELRAQITDLNVELAMHDAQNAANTQEQEQAAANGDIEITVERQQPSEVEILRGIMSDPKVVETVARINRSKAQIIQLEDAGLVPLRQEFYQELQDKRDEAIAQLEEEKESARERVVATLAELCEKDFEQRTLEAREAIKTARSNAIAQARQTRADIETKLRVLQDQYSQERTRLEQFGGDSAELQFAYEELSVASGVLRKLRDRVAAIRTERRQDGAVRSLARAAVPRSPVEKMPLKNLALASGAAFMLPFLLGFLWEFKVQRVTDIMSVEKTAHLHVMGEVARLPSGARTGRTRRIFEESIDSLRANMFLSADTKNTRSIAVTSSMSGEGKSSVASQLAVSIAKASGKTVLLIDADIRCPDQHDIFGLEMGPGLCGVLMNEATLTQSIDTSLGNLVHVLPAGRATQSPHRIINETSIKKVIDEALDRYNVVVIDTAPVLAAGETLAITANVDATLLCLMRDVSRMEHVTRTTRRLEAAGASIAGTVFSGVTPRQYAYRYGNYNYVEASEPVV